MQKFTPMKKLFFFLTLATAFLTLSTMDVAASNKTNQPNSGTLMTITARADADGLKSLVASPEVKPEDVIKMEEKYNTRMAKAHPFFRKVCNWLGWAAVGMAVVFFAFAIPRRKIWNVLAMIPIALLLFIIAKKCAMPTWLMMFVFPFIAYVITYPLLYIRTPWLAYQMGCFAIALGAAGYYFWHYMDVYDSARHSLSLIHLLLYIGILVVTFFITFFISNRNVEDICPHCGYFAKHSRGASHKTGTDVSYGSETDTVYDGTTEKMIYSTNTKVITKHYHDEQYETKTTTTHYETDRTCMRCGGAYTSHSTSSTTTRKRVG